MFDNLDQLGVFCSECTKCSISALHYDKLVCVGRGSYKAKLLLVAPIPIENDNDTGYPLVGLSGVLLEKMLESVEIYREDYYISNIQKCTISNDNEVNKECAENCLPYLDEQIRLINPTIIVCLGANVLHTLTGHKAKITQDRGNIYSYKDRLYMLMYHPNYLLTHPTLEQGKHRYMTWLDLIKLKKILDGDSIDSIQLKEKRQPKKKEQKQEKSETYDDIPF